VDLRELRYFVTLAEELSFTRAAATLGIAQPSLSHQIKKLETDLGTPLFHRSQRTVALTAAGRSVLAEARTLLEQADVTREVARLVAAGEFGELRIGFLEAAAFALLPQLISAFRQAYPKIAIRLFELTTIEQLPALRERAIDVGIFRAPIPADDIDTMPILREPVAVALPSTHPLTKRASIRLDALRDEGFIFHSDSRTTRLLDEVTALTRQLGYVPRVVQEAGEFHTICSLVAGGLGIALVPSSAQAIRMHGIAYRKLTHPGLTIDYCLGWLRGSRGPTLKAFQSIIPAT
jgi:DNA-binding transcriptional LysR family regulator